MFAFILMLLDLHASCDRACSRVRPHLVTLPQSSPEADSAASTTPVMTSTLTLRPSMSTSNTSVVVEVNLADAARELCSGSLRRLIKAQLRSWEQIAAIIGGRIIVVKMFNEVQKAR